MPYLPETNPEEYVRNWCTTHTTLQNDTKTIRKSGYAIPSDDCDSIGSSLQESIEADPKIIQFENVTFRAKQCQQEPKNFNISPSCRKLSRESGILTLPDSTLDYASEIDNLEKQEVSEISGRESRRQNSGYFTCSSEDPNAFERNIDSSGEKIIEESVNTLEENGLNDARIGDGLLISSNTSSELSYVTVSEWYRYTDAEEGVTLFEKRLLKSTSRFVLDKILSRLSLTNTEMCD